MLHRRSFLQSSALLPMAPAFVARMARAAGREKDAPPSSSSSCAAATTASTPSSR